VTKCIGLPTGDVDIDFQQIKECILSMKGVFMKKEHYSCWEDSKTQAFAYNQLLDFVMNLTSLDPPSGGELWEAQAAWGEGVADVVLGFFRNSDMMKDEQKSGLNQAFATELNNETRIVHHPTMLSVNNVCNGGEELRQSLLGRVQKLSEKLK